LSRASDRLTGIDVVSSGRFDAHRYDLAATWTLVEGAWFVFGFDILLLAGSVFVRCFENIPRTFKPRRLLGEYPGVKGTDSSPVAKALSFLASRSVGESSPVTHLPKGTVLFGDLARRLSARAPQR
jgi:hypothetical protein